MKKILKSIFCVKRIPVIIAFVILVIMFAMISVMLFHGRKGKGQTEVQMPKTEDKAVSVLPQTQTKEETQTKAEELPEELPEKTGPTPEELYIPYSEECAAKRAEQPNALCQLDGECAVNLRKYDGENVCIDKYANEVPVVYIGSSFKLPKRVKSLELPDSVLGILSAQVDKLSDKGAFLGNNTLETFIPSDNFKYIGNKAFYECSALSDVFLPITLRHIGDRAFYGCTALTDIKIYGKIAIGEGAFAGCTSLENVYLSENVRRVGLGAFDDTPFYEALTQEFGIVGDVLVRYNGKAADVVIPDGVRIIADGVFAGRLSVKSVTFPKSVEYIGNSAFRSCARLETVKLDGSPVMGINAFEGCTDSAVKTVSVLSVNPRDEFYSEENFKELMPDE